MNRICNVYEVNNNRTQAWIVWGVGGNKVVRREVKDDS